MPAWDEGLEVREDDGQTKRQQEGGRSSRARVGGHKRLSVTNAVGDLTGKRRGTAIGSAADSLGETGLLCKSRFPLFDFFPLPVL